MDLLVYLAGSVYRLVHSLANQKASFRVNGDSYLIIKSNMIVMEVIPFLLLAIGGDNIFLLLLDVNRN